MSKQQSNGLTLCNMSLKDLSEELTRSILRQNILERMNDCKESIDMYFGKTGNPYCVIVSQEESIRKIASMLLEETNTHVNNIIEEISKHKKQWRK